MKNQRGFTLVEVMVAIVLLAVGVFALLSTITFSQRSVSISEEFVVANIAAANALEALKVYAAGNRGDNFGYVYQAYQNYDYANGFFYVLEDGRISYTTAGNVIGLGWYEFVTIEGNDQNTPDLLVEWGTDLVTTDATGDVGIDLNLDGDIAINSSFTLGQTSGSLGDPDKYACLPVKVIVVITASHFTGSTIQIDGVPYNFLNGAPGVVVVRKGWLTVPNPVQ